MSSTRYCLLVLLLLIALPAVFFAQTNPHELFIPATTTEYLNKIIMGDTTATGARNDSSRIYVLERGGAFQVNASIRNVKWTLRIKSTNGTGPRPAVYLVPTGVSGSKNPPGQFVDCQGTVIISNLNMNGYAEPDTAFLANLQGSLFQVNATGYDLILDSCVISNTNGNHLRTGSSARVIKVTNCIFANMGFLGTSNLGAGKAIDLRDQAVDTLVFQNCTFVNYQDRIIRHRTSKYSIKNLVFDHNTVVNGMSYHGMLALGWVGKRMQITNNLFYDPFALGNDTDATRQAEFNESGEKDQYGFARMNWVQSVPNDTTIWVVKHNYYGISADGQAWFNKYTSAGVTGEGVPLTWHINRKLGADSTDAFKKATFTLGKVPKLMTAEMDWYRSPSGGKKTKNTPTALWNLSYDFDRRVMEYFTDTMDCKYATTHEMYTAADNGLPVGDLNWYPSKKAVWLTGVETPISNQPVEYTLGQNYPNPFNPSTVIRYSVAKASNVKIEVFNILGQKVATLFNGLATVGSHEVTWHPAVASGVYFYKMEASENGGAMKFTQVRKAVFMK